eukprot:scpid105457/ scgid33759/ 
MDSAKAKLGMGRQKLAADGSPRPPPKRPRFPAADVIIDGVNDDDSPPSTLLFGATPLPDAELVINEQGKLDRLKIQSTSPVFKQYIMIKFSKLCFMNAPNMLTPAWLAVSRELIVPIQSIRKLRETWTMW